MEDKKTFKEEHGETRVGKFLREIDKSAVVAKAISIAGSGVTGGWLGAVGELLGGNTEMSDEHRAHAIKLLELDIKEQEAITKRWEADLNSDSWLSKNIRPMTLAVLTAATLLFILADSAFAGFTIDPQWIDLLKNSLSVVFFAYFGSRGVEKGVKTWKK